MPVTAKTLIIGPSWIGDMIMAQSLFRILKQRDPAPDIDVLAPDWTHALLGHMPEISRALAMPVGHGELGLRRRWRLANDLRDAQYTQAIILPNSFKSALIPWLAKIPVRSGFRGELRYGLLNDLRVLDKQALPLMVQRFVALGLDARAPLPNKLPPPRLAPDPAGVARALARLGIDRASVGTGAAPMLALCPGAEYGAAKRWPAASFAEIAQDRLNAGWSVWLFGSAIDREATAIVNEQSGGRCVDLAGRTRLDEAIDLLSLASAVISNDSGLMHMAAALDRPMVALFGSSSPAFTPPLSKRAAIIYRDLDCSPCFKRECPLGHLNCLNGIEPEQVLTRLDEMLSA